MIFLSYFASHWLLFFGCVLAVIGLGAASWFLKNWKLAAGAIVLLVAGLAYQSSNMDGYKRRVNEEATAKIKVLQGRLDALQRVAVADTLRAQADNQKLSELEKLARETPKNAGACLDAAAARRVRAVR